MQNQKEKSCADCAHFARHYYKLSSRNYRMTLYGHCEYDKRGRPHRQDERACEKFAPAQQTQA